MLAQPELMLALVREFGLCSPNSRDFGATACLVFALTRNGAAFGVQQSFTPRL